MTCSTIKEAIKLGLFIKRFNKNIHIFRTINWEKIQEYHNEGNGWREISKKFNISSETISRAKKKGLLETRTGSESSILSHNKHKRTHTEETKKKISIIRKKYLEEHPDKVPYKLNHYSKGPSYPETYFDEIFNGKFKYEKYLQIGIYQLDIAIPEKMIGIEIDGNQHYLDKRIVESDIKKDEYLKNNGWDLIRIRWSDYQKMKFKEKEEYIKNLIDYINKLIDKKPIIICEIKIKYKNKCECGNLKDRKAKKCLDCYKKERDKNFVKNHPSLETLENEIKQFGYCSTGRKYNVSDNTIRKWIKKYKKLLL